MAPTRRGDGTGVNPNGIVEVRKGDGTVLWSPRRFTDFEGSADGWGTYTTGKIPDSWGIHNTDKAYSGDYTAHVKENTGINGYGGVSKQFDMARAETLEFQVQYSVDAWGSVDVVLEDSSGPTSIWSESARGNATSTSSWQSISVDISEYDSEFRLTFGNFDDGSNATYSDHGFEIWTDDVLIE